jgi:imidazolonepropionase-like amidohydrolase
MLKISLLMLALAMPGRSGADTLVIVGGTVHPVSSEPFVGNVVVTDGRIAAVGADVAAPAGSRTMDAAGLHVYPGLFDAISQLGLTEIGAVAATDDQAEMGTYNPHLLAATAIHPASEVIPVARANGITHTLVAPRTGSDGVIAGQAALVNLAGWTVAEMTVDPALAMVISWPRIQTRRFDFTTFTVEETPYKEAKEKAEKTQNELRDWLDAARHYRQAMEGDSPRLETDPKLAALAQVLDGKMPVIIIAACKADIEAALAFAEEEDLNMILAGGRDAWQVKELLAEKKVPVILGMTESLPHEDDLPYDRPFRNPGELAAAGVKIALGSGAGGGFGPGGPHGSRTLPYEAEAAVSYGLSAAEALRALTLNPAEIFGLDADLGSIEAGKIANLIVTDGDPLQIQTRIKHVYIAGSEVATDNKHKSLYELYLGRK